MVEIEGGYFITLSNETMRIIIVIHSKLLSSFYASLTGNVGENEISLAG